MRCQTWGHRLWFGVAAASAVSVKICIMVAEREVGLAFWRHREIGLVLREDIPRKGSLE